MPRRNPDREIPLAPEPKRRKPRAPSADMPAPIHTPESEREALAAWWRSRMEQVEREHEERVALLRAGGEHPTPAYARHVKMLGHLGLEKSLVLKVLGISDYTFETHYRGEYETGAADLIVSVAANMVRIGTSISDPANAKVGMDILARRGGVEWKPPAQQVKMEDDRVKPDKGVIDTSTWAPEKRDELRRLLLEQLDNEAGEATGE